MGSDNEFAFLHFTKASVAVGRLRKRERERERERDRVKRTEMGSDNEFAFLPLTLFFACLLCVVAIASLSVNSVITQRIRPAFLSIPSISKLSGARFRIIMKELKLIFSNVLDVSGNQSDET